MAPPAWIKSRYGLLDRAGGWLLDLFKRREKEKEKKKGKREGKERKRKEREKGGEKIKQVEPVQAAHHLWFDLLASIGETHDKLSWTVDDFDFRISVHPHHIHRTETQASHYSVVSVTTSITLNLSAYRSA